MNRIDKAFTVIKRKEFLPESMKQYAAIDAPLQIGFGQTNSQPSTVRRMLVWLNPKPSDKVLDVGSGSGWTSALLATIVGESGHVHAVELIPELVKFGKENAAKLQLDNLFFHEANKDTFGWPEEAPYDKILVSASAKTLPKELIDQLKIGGRLVIPIKNSIFVYDKKTNDQLEKTEYPGFVFVPLI